MSFSCIYVLSNLCVKNWLRIGLNSDWVVVQSRLCVIMKILKFWLHLNSDQARPRRSGSGFWCVGALLNHSHTVVVFKSSAQETQHSGFMCLSHRCLQTIARLFLTHCFNMYNSVFTCFRMFVPQLDVQRVVRGPLDSSELLRTCKLALKE